jgi:lipopolysaccharide export LptBFGC system permease protein LptF
LAWKLYWYLVKEILSLTALIVAAVSVVMFLFRLLAYADYIFVSKDGVASILMFILFLLPSILKMTLPISLMLASAIVFIRMSSDRELEAWLSVGVGPLRLAVAPALVGVAMALFSGYVSLFVEPFARQEWRKFKYLHARKSIETLVESSLQEKTFLSDIFQTGQSEVSLYVDKVKPNRKDLEGVFLAFNQTDEPYSMILLAQSGSLSKTSEEGPADFILKLNNGRYLQPSQHTKNEQSGARSLFDPNSKPISAFEAVIDYDKEAYANPGGDGPALAFVGPPKPFGYKYPKNESEKTVVAQAGESRAAVTLKPAASAETAVAEGLPKGFVQMAPVKSWSVVHFSEMRISLLNLFSKRFDPSFLEELDLRSLYPRAYIRELKKLRVSEEWGKNQKFMRDYSFFYEQIVVPFSCVFLPLVGLCLGIQDPRRKAGFAYLGLGIVVFVFYFSLMVCQRLALNFFVPPETSLVVPPLVLAAMTAMLLKWRNGFPPSVSFLEFVSLSFSGWKMAKKGVKK